MGKSEKMPDVKKMQEPMKQKKMATASGVKVKAPIKASGVKMPKMHGPAQYKVE